MSEQQPPKRWNRTRLPFDDKPSNLLADGAKRGAFLFYGVLAIVLVGVAFYMALVEQRPLMSAWVVAPAIGAAWFALRVFMTLPSKK